MKYASSILFLLSVICYALAMSTTFVGEGLFAMTGLEYLKYGWDVFGIEATFYQKVFGFLGWTSNLWYVLSVLLGMVLGIVFMFYKAGYLVRMVLFGKGVLGSAILVLLALCILGLPGIGGGQDSMGFGVGWYFWWASYLLMVISGIASYPRKETEEDALIPG